MISEVSNINTEIVSNRNNIESFVKRQQTIMDKLKILTDAAKYDVACTSSGVDRAGGYPIQSGRKPLPVRARSTLSGKHGLR